LRFLLERALTKKQLQILDDLKKNNYKSKTSAVRNVSKKYGIALSTVKWNYSVLEDIGLIRNKDLTQVGGWVHKLFC